MRSCFATLVPAPARVSDELRAETRRVPTAAVVFDLFGTLLDVASLGAAASQWTAEPAAFVATWREKQLAYAFAATIVNRYEDFDALTLHALRYACARHGVTLGEPEAIELAAAWCRAAPFGDVAPALAALREAAVPAAVLTNGTLATAHAALAHAGLANALDTTFSVDAVRAYKPSPRVYALLTAHYGVAAERLTFVTSNGWDAMGAAEFGLRTIWCNRSGVPAETFGAPPATIIGSLRELRDALRQAESAQTT